MIPLGILASSVRRASAALLAPTNLVATLVESVPADPHWDKVVSLIHFDDPAGSTTFNDEKGFTWDATSGTPKMSEDAPKFGIACGSFDGAGDQISYPAETFGLGTGDFTIEGWVRFNSVGFTQYFMATSGSPFIWLDIGGGSVRKVTAYIQGAQRTSSSEAVAGEWYHVALSRSAGSVRFFFNGIQQGAPAPGGSEPKGVFSLGGASNLSSSYLNGQLDEWRITKGVARYTENFTPPTTPFPNFGPPPPLPTVIGEPYGGGFYAGDIQYPDGQWYKLIVADKAADITGADSRWKTTVDDSPGTNHLVDGLANTQAMAIVGIELHPAGGHCLDYRGGGFDDWYMASKDELNAVFLGLGPNRPSCPLIFRSGGLQAFDELAWYWTSTQRSASNAWSQHFSNGTQNEQYQGGKYVDDHRVRPIRRIAFTPD